MSQKLAASLRDLARRLGEDNALSRADFTRDFWRVAQQIRAALPPLLLPHRSGSNRRRLGYLVLARPRVTQAIAELHQQHHQDDDVWLFRLGATTAATETGWARTVELANVGEAQAARIIAGADLDVLADMDGATLGIAPLIIALRPARAIVEPLFDPAMDEGLQSGNVAVGTVRDISQLAQSARAAADRVRGNPDRTTVDPAQVNALLERAIRLHRQGDLASAQSSYAAIVSQCAEHPVAAYLLGQLLHQHGEPAEAIRWLRRAADWAPEFRDAHYTLGQRLADAGRWKEASNAYRRAVELTPQFAPGWSGLGLAAEHDGDATTREGVAYLERAVALEPDVPQWHFNLGAAAQRRGDVSRARHAYRQVLARRPDHIEARFNLGAIAQDGGDYPAAIAAYREVIKSHPEFVPAYPQLGACLQLQGEIEAWLENFQRYRSTCAESLAMAVYGLEASMVAGDLAAHIDWRDRILAGTFPTEDRAEYLRNWEQLLFLLLHVDVDREVLHRWYLRYDETASAWYGGAAALPILRTPGPIRIGYLSGDLRDHVMGHMIHGWLSRHDRSRFSVTLYSLSALRDVYTARFEALGSPIVELWAQPHEVAAARIHADEIDLLIDCSGHTRGAQPGILARKPARVIATHIATPGPVGLHAIDYKLTERLAESDDAQQFVIERLFRVASGVFPWRRYPEIDTAFYSQLRMPGGSFVCGAFVSLMKLSPRCLGLWRKVLERLPRAILAFSPVSPSWNSSYRRWLQANGIEAGRVVFLPRPPTESGQLARYRLLDVALDPLPCGNVNGTMEALAMGVPVVTLLGPRHGERLGHALLSRFGTSETVARTEDDYVSLVVRLAEDKEWAAALRTRIADARARSLVWDAAAHVRGLEAAYEQMLAEKSVTGGKQ